MDGELVDRIRAAARGCERAVVGGSRRTPAETLRDLATVAEELELEVWDVYGDGGAVERLESEVAELFDKPAAAFFPSGVMAQQAALRSWCDRSGSRRVALPDLSHLLRHEDDGPRRLHGFEVDHLTTGPATPTVADLERLSPGLGAALVELPLRDAGCLLPTWEDLTALSTTARAHGIPLHADGARIWESQPFYDRTLPEIAALFDSMYVSFYKGLGAPAGAALVGPEDVIAEARTWRRRMGGTLYRLTPYALGALAGLRDRLPRMGDVHLWALALARELSSYGVQTRPDPPHCATSRIYAGGEADAINERLLKHLEREHVVPCHPWFDTEVPGVAQTELAACVESLEFDPAEVARWIGELVASKTL